MIEINPKVDKYLAEGCMRCELGGTPRCKVHSWTDELHALREILLDSGLTEELKWSVPVYTHEKKNIVIMSAFKEYCALSFFKGALLKDPEGILDKAGKNTQSARLIRFTNSQDILKLEPVLRAYIAEAIEVEQAGLKVEYKPTSEYPIPEEFQQKLDQNPALKAAFDALTPGRQRGYLLHFSQPKQSKTRASRVEKYSQQILAGKGLYDK
jgi:uncharacterized protein YdeI (YjbR/CyaY-like superfamily)